VVREQAKHLGIQRIVAVSFFLAHKLLDAPLPDFFRAQVQKGASSKLRLGGGFAAIENLANEIIPVLAEGADYNPESISYFKLMIRVRERWQDRIKFLWRLIFTPSVGEWSAIPLPDLFFPLYRIIRVFRLMSRLIS